MIRRATDADIPEIVEMGARFLAYSMHRDIPLDREAFAETARLMISGGILLLSDEGMLGGFLVPLYFNPAYVAAAEVFWFAPKEGSALKAAFEEWAVESGAYAIQFSAIADDRISAVDRIYRRSGFKPVEMAYLKRVS